MQTLAKNIGMHNFLISSGARHMLRRTIKPLARAPTRSKKNLVHGSHQCIMAQAANKNKMIITRIIPKVDPQGRL